MPTVTIDSALCCGDTLCVRVCPAGCFRMKGDKAATVPLAMNVCIECGQCLAVCPKGAISLNGTAPETRPFAPKKHDAEAFAQLVTSRRSIRNYQDKPVPRDVLEGLLNTVSFSPTGKNRQDVCWLAMDDKRKIRDLADAVINKMRDNKDAARLVEAHDQGMDPIFRGAPLVVFAHAEQGAYGLNPTDCAVATGYLELALHASGLGSCWAGYALGIAQLFEDVRRVMGVPVDRQVYGGLMVGYPAFRYARIPLRKEPVIDWA